MNITPDFYKRLSAFYQRVHDGQTELMSQIWSTIFNSWHTSLDQTLRAGDLTQIEKILEIDNTIASGMISECWANDNLMIIANVLGLRPRQNPQQPFVIGNCDKKIILDELEKSSFGPRFIPVNWLSIPGSDFSYRYPTTVYVAGSIRMAFGSQIKILEIGPGFGYVALMMQQSGCRQYSVVDLPMGAVITAWVIAKTIGEDHVWFCGEPNKEKIDIKVYGPNQVNSCDPELDIIFNCDSFPEIANEVQLAYLKVAHRILKDRGFIFSINQESTNSGQRSISEAVMSSGLFRCVSRKIFPLREGYMEEIFVKK